MKQLLWIAVILLSIPFSCKNRELNVKHSDTIDIEKGLNNLARLKISDFGETIRYIPLETTDDGLVGRDPIVKVLRNHIVIEAQGSCLLFDKTDGRFIASIGHFGQDPAAYTGSFSWTDKEEDFLYFSRQPNQLVKYDMKGNFNGKIEFPSSSGLASSYLLTDSEVIGYFGGTIQSSNPFILGIFDGEGNLRDTFPPFFPQSQGVTPDEIAGINVERRRDLYGSLSRFGIITINLKNDTRKIITPNAARIWRSNGNIRFKEEFVDTIYTVSDSKLIPHIVFNTGKFHWSIQDATDKKSANERIYISDVFENNHFVFFQCIRGMYSANHILYNGLYYKKTGETKLGKYSDNIEDDLTRFMPFIPMGMSTAGEFVSLVEVWEVMEWLEKHPEAMNNEKLSFLKKLDEDMNPIIILVE